MATILLDCDGPCSSFPTRLLEEMRSVSDNVPNEDDIYVWDFIHEVFNEKQRKLAYMICKDHTFWSSINPVEGAIKAFSKMIKDGHEIVWITSPWYSCTGWFDARSNWIRKHFGHRKHEIIFASNKYRTYGNFLIEDKLENLIEWQRHHPGGVPLLFKAKCNRNDMEKVQKFSLPIKLFTWDDYLNEDIKISNDGLFEKCSADSKTSNITDGVKDIYRKWS